MGAGKSRSKNILNSAIGENDDGVLSSEPLPSDVDNLIGKDVEELMNSDIDKISPITEDTVSDVLNTLGICELNVFRGAGSLSVQEINYDDEAPYRVRVALDTLSNIANTYENITGEKIIANFSFVKSKDENIGMYNKDMKSVAITMSDLQYDAWGRKSKTNYNALPIKAKGSVSHELGHAVMYNLLDSNNKSKVLAFNKKALKMSAVSTYGNSSLDEAFAEAFSLYSHGVSSSTKSGSKYYSEFKKLMKDCGLSDLYGCTK